MSRLGLLCMGQCISILVSITGVVTQYLNQYYHINVPATQNMGCYLLLFLMWVFHQSPKDLILGRTKLHLNRPLWQYALMALADVEGNYFAVLAYNYTSISSAMVLDCVTIPIVMLLSVHFVNAQYEKEHFQGVIVCTVGILLLLVSDLFHSKSSSDSLSSSFFHWKALEGDCLVLVGCSIYACSNVAQEISVKTNDRMEFLGMIGFFGLLYTSIQAAVFEGRKLMEIEWCLGSISLLAAYSVIMFIMYNMTSVFLREADSAVLNMSLLTSDMYAVLFGLFLFHENLSLLYIIGLVFILSGSVLYDRGHAPTREYIHQKETMPLIEREFCIFSDSP